MLLICLEDNAMLRTSVARDVFSFKFPKFAT